MDNLISELIIQCSRIATALESMAQADAPKEPNYKYPFDQYMKFDWSVINAHVLGEDEYGVTLVNWSGHTWKRRSWPAKYGNVVGFSRADGMGDNGVEWLTLIAFKEMTDTEPLPSKIQDTIKQSAERPSTPTPKSTTARTPPPPTESEQRQTAVKPTPDKAEDLDEVFPIDYKERAVNAKALPMLVRHLADAFCKGNLDDAEKGFDFVTNGSGYRCDSQHNEAIYTSLEWYMADMKNRASMSPGGVSSQDKKTAAETAKEKYRLAIRGVN